MNRARIEKSTARTDNIFETDRSASCSYCVVSVLISPMTKEENRSVPYSISRKQLDLEAYTVTSLPIERGNNARALHTCFAHVYYATL